MNSKVEISRALDKISLALEPEMAWGITGGANYAIRRGSERANDIDIICSLTDMPTIVDALFKLQPKLKKSRCQNIRSVYSSHKIGNVKIEIFSDVENLWGGTWLPNRLYRDCINRGRIANCRRLNLMSIAYEIHINALIGNLERCKEFIELDNLNRRLTHSQDRADA